MVLQFPDVWRNKDPGKDAAVLCVCNVYMLEIILLIESLEFDFLKIILVFCGIYMQMYLRQSPFNSVEY